MIKLNGKVVDVNRFPDGTLLLKEEPGFHCDLKSATIQWFFENNEELVLNGTENVEEQAQREELVDRVEDTRPGIDPALQITTVENMIANALSKNDIAAANKYYEDNTVANSTNDLEEGNLKNNLNENEYNELMSYLTSRPQETVESCQRINGIISTLYRNINNREIRDDRNIYNENGFHIKRVYFNEEKMTYDDAFSNKELYGEDFVHINEIFPDQTIKINKNMTLP